ncbi:hypothetical protein FK178_03285 [Antarcticibacterium arcticum]|uniref:Bacterial spore germination immunoglobulin-like domain-containing protein n=1 Tax=Antarcticibacterium arcticum TaxID=2585771 RepID=A0A5B8YGS0_9FLAO|nr:Gmad2 immunoglobulin-like domain-containing protein [Antarcticibacterium arcticum]QED36791.1 hypothetical protein FK178_03285 [Antarcticibacterium arcticum]
MQKLIWLVFLLLLTSCGEQKKSNKDPDPVVPKRETPVNPTKDLLSITNPRDGEQISSPLPLEGRARGYWFFEADAPVTLVDEYYSVLSQTYITAVGDWMTEDWVEFRGELSFPEPPTKTGYIIFYKANPSGLKEHSNSDTIRVVFK